MQTTRQTHFLYHAAAGTIKAIETQEVSKQRMKKQKLLQSLLQENAGGVR
jgi:hypothetical protein